MLYSEKIIERPVESIPPESGWWIEFKDAKSETKHSRVANLLQYWESQGQSA